MANGRLWLKCRKCGGKKLLMKYWGSGVAQQDDTEMWMDTHLFDCYELPIDLSDQADGPLFVLEGE
jgi:hypothetical protein